MSIYGWYRNGGVERELAENSSLLINIDIRLSRVPEIRH